MKPLSDRDHEIAEALALAIADAMVKAIPALFAEPPETVVAVAMPIAAQLVAYERKARRNRNAARKYRRLCAQTRQLLRTEDGAAVEPGVLPQTVPFDPEAWHVELRPGIGTEHLEVP